MPTDNDRQQNLALVDQVDNLSDEVKNLALSLALYLAKVKSGRDAISRIEPEFISLVNGTIKVVQEVTLIIDAARNKRTLVYRVSSGDFGRDRIETKLQSILEQCNSIMTALSRRTDIKI